LFLCCCSYDSDSVASRLHTHTLDAFLGCHSSNDQPNKLPTSLPASLTTSTSTSSGSYHQQADAMEFFTFLLDALHEEMRGIDCSDWLVYDHTSSSGSSSSAIAGFGSSDAADDGWEEVGKGKSKVNIDENQSKQVAKEVIQSSVISQTFHGSLKSTVLYERKRTTSITYQRFHCLQLDVRGPLLKGRHCSNHVTLSHALLTYCSEEVCIFYFSNNIIYYEQILCVYFTAFF
jgi:hypothetical protein